MKRVAYVFAISLLVASCATMQSQRLELVSRGVQAVGGADTLGRVTTYYEKGTVKQWEPEQSHTPGGEMRFAAESTFETVSDVASRTTATDWSRKLAYPAPRQHASTKGTSP